VAHADAASQAKEGRSSRAEGLLALDTSGAGRSP
jgi:hypothetical protein